MQHPRALLPHMRKFRPPRNMGCFGRTPHDYSPSNWNNYFTSKQDVHVGNNVFRIYLNQDETNSDYPLLLLLHGGGFNALTWSVFVKSLAQLCYVRIMAIDIRGHGSSKTDNDTDLSVETLIDDITAILSSYFGEQIPQLVLMGHSMGGALAIHFADKCKNDIILNRLLGLIVIDVVEGTAKEALSQMQQVLRSRPKGFKSITNAIEWCIRSGQVRNVESARISMPGQIKNSQTGICAADLIDNQEKVSKTDSLANDNLSPTNLTTVNENEETVSNTNCIINENNHPFIWRINLSQTEPFWVSWFDNLSEIFLSSKGGAKMLLLAGVDRLDGPMTVGQMQGKFQMQILPRVGHIIQEDDPDTVARIVALYFVRNRFSLSKVDLEPEFFPSC